MVAKAAFQEHTDFLAKEFESSKADAIRLRHETAVLQAGPRFSDAHIESAKPARCAHRPVQKSPAVALTKPGLGLRRGRRLRRPHRAPAYFSLAVGRRYSRRLIIGQHGLPRADPPRP